MIWRSSTTANSRGGDRAPDQAHDVHDGGGLGDLGVAEVEVGGGRHRHHRQPEPEAAGEERQRQPALVGRGRDEAERHRRRGHQQDAEGHDAPWAEPVGHGPGPAHDARRTEALGRHEEAGLPGLLAAGHLVVDGQQEHGAEQRRPDDEDADVGDGEVAVLERVQLEQWVLHVEGVEHEPHRQPQPQHEADQDGGAGEGAGGPDLGKGVEQSGQAGAQQAEPQPVERGGGVGAVRGVEPRQPAAARGSG